MSAILLFLSTLLLGAIVGFFGAFFLIAYVVKHAKKNQLEKALKELNSSLEDDEDSYEDDEEENLDEEEISED